MNAISFRYPGYYMTIVNLDIDRCQDNNPELNFFARNGSFKQIEHEASFQQYPPAYIRTLIAISPDIDSNHLKASKGVVTLK